MMGAGDCTDDVAEKILSATVNALLNVPIRWKSKSVRKDGRASQLEGNVPVRSDLSERFDLIFRIKVDLAWEYTLILRHLPSGTNIRRLDVRGRTGTAWVRTISVARISIVGARPEATRTSTHPQTYATIQPCPQMHRSLFWMRSTVGFCWTSWASATSRSVPGTPGVAHLHRPTCCR